MPIGYYGWWQKKEAELAKKYRDWLPPEGISSSRWVRPEQKKKEMELADVVITACSFARNTIREFFDKEVKLASYGIDLSEPTERKPRKDGIFRVVYAGTASVRKGTPLLLERWKKLGWKDAELVLAGSPRSMQLLTVIFVQLVMSMQELAMAPVDGRVGLEIVTA